MKIFATTFLFTLLSVAAFSQNLTVGIKGGTSTTTFKGDYTYSSSNLYDNSKTSSVIISEYVNYKLSSFLSLQAEVSFQKKGFEYKTKPSIQDYAAKGSAEFGYLQIPILLQFSYGSKLKVYANGGASINLLVSDGMYKYYYMPNILWPTVTFAPVLPNEGIQNIKSDFNKVTLGIVGSAGLSYDITPTIGILGEFRVGYDLGKSAKNKNIAVEDGKPYVNYDDTHFLNYSVQGGVYFLLGK